MDSWDKCGCGSVCGFMGLRLLEKLKCCDLVYFKVAERPRLGEAFRRSPLLWLCWPADECIMEMGVPLITLGIGLVKLDPLDGDFSILAPFDVFD
ncbi:hypothetical protein BpHYR1_042866 [Brachionus plicatilis]|uniref:Uncharacterized protein n=1 Tax=Brachionus plicatilis TaxID=10195 RepID=A0A3M7PVY3_BRAPC|nr:hypothetical protein BpHYR1_042866 [Brachionus plicatilis]